MLGLPEAPLTELKLETEPLRSSFPLTCCPFLALVRAGVLNAPPPTSIGGDAPGDVTGEEDGPSGREREGGFVEEDMVVLDKLSAKSEADNSLDRVRAIFLDGV